VKDEDGCGQAARVLRKQGSRLELAGRWSGKEGRANGIDVQFRWGRMSSRMHACMHACMDACMNA